MRKTNAIELPVDPLPNQAREKDFLVVEGLRQNNLKNLSFKIPHDAITAIVGLSGSGKSSIAFDTLFAEGRWRFIESLSTYTRLFLERMDRPDLDSIRNIRPAIAIEQKNPVRTSRSTVGTITEINDCLRLLFARVGKLFCPACGSAVEKTDSAAITDRLIRDSYGHALMAGFTVNMAGREAGALYDALMKKGFTRVKAGGAVYNLSDGGAPEDPGLEIGVIADRFVVKAGERARITESLDAALREGLGRAWIEDSLGNRENLSRDLSCAKCGLSVERPTPFSLSFNHPVGACEECKGFGNLLSYDEDKIIPDKGLTLRNGAIEPWTKPAYTWCYEELEGSAARHSISLDTPFSKLTRREQRLLFDGTDDFDGIDEFFRRMEVKKYKLHIKVFISRYKGQIPCPACAGTRLKPLSRNVRLNGKTISDAASMSVAEAGVFFKALHLTRQEREVADEVLRQISMKLDFMNQTGLGYLTLDRLTKTLSGGEAQRVSLATQLASSLCGVMYILDEPSIGLHPADIKMLIKQVKRLAALGNTVVIVEHDGSVITEADHIVELGPGAGERGGRIVYSGAKADFLRSARTVTADYLTGRQKIHVPVWRRNGSGKTLRLSGAAGNNLKGVDLALPLKTMTCVTGVSGSGKSSLIVDTLYNALAVYFDEKGEKPLPYGRMEGAGHLSGVNLIDQAPIGRTPRSNPLTYVGGLDEIRKLYAKLPSAVNAGFTAAAFSFNVPGGRCETCRGEGVEKLEMYFLPDIYIKCAVCGGRRYSSPVLEIKYRGKSIYDCLNMTFDEAGALFSSELSVQKRFVTLKDVGLGYLKLGQSATTLSGGEAQRLKIARELSESGASGDKLYILDEPTTGLHPDDTRRLLSVLGRLVDAGNTVVMIEHNLDCVKSADHVIDMGPGGGANGGRIVAAGAPEEIVKVRESLTGRFLKGAL